MAVEWSKEMVPRIVIFTLCLLLMVSACLPVSQESQPRPTHLVIGLLPDRTPEQLLRIHQPLFDFLAEQLNITYQFVIPDNYADMLSQFNHGKIDLAFFGGITFIKAKQYGSASPVVAGNRDLNFISYLIVRNDSKIDSLAGLKNKSLAFGSPLSTSGHVMPRFYMKKIGITPEHYFSEVQYSGSHSNTIQRVAQNVVDAGVLNSHVFKDKVEEVENLKENLTVIWQSPPYPDYVWAMQTKYSKEFIQELTDAFLSINVTTPTGRTILQQQKSDAFYPVSNADFSEIEQALQLLKSNHD